MAGGGRSSDGYGAVRHRCSSSHRYRADRSWKSQARRDRSPILSLLRHGVDRQVLMQVGRSGCGPFRPKRLGRVYPTVRWLAVANARCVAGIEIDNADGQRRFGLLVLDTDCAPVCRNLRPLDSFSPRRRSPPTAPMGVRGDHTLGRRDNRPMPDGRRPHRRGTCDVAPLSRVVSALQWRDWDRLMLLSEDRGHRSLLG